MSRIRGQLSLPSIVLLVAVVSGVFISILGINEPIVESVEYNTGDFNEIARSSMKVEAFEERLKGEINYTSNNLAIEEIEWNDNVPPSDDAVDNHLDRLKNRLDEQMDPAGACRTSGIGEVELSSGSTTEYRVDTSETDIICDDEATQANIPIEKAEYVVDNSKNRKVDSVNYSANYTRNLKARMDKMSFETTGNGGQTSSCPGSPSSKGTAKRQARNDANNTISAKTAGAIGNEKTDGDEKQIDWISIQTNSIVPVGECVSFSTSSNSCTYSCNCETDEDGDRECDTCSDTVYSAKCEWETEALKLDFSITDDENRLITYNGNITPEFPWGYRYDN